MKCEYCGIENNTDETNCSSCGATLKIEKKEAVTFDINLNVQEPEVQVEEEYKNKWVSLALCVFLGVLGIHKFYEGKVGMGFVYMFTYGLFTIGVIVDFFIILFKPTRYKV